MGLYKWAGEQDSEAGGGNSHKHKSSLNQQSQTSPLFGLRPKRVSSSWTGITMSWESTTWCGPLCRIQPWTSSPTSWRECCRQTPLQTAQGSSASSTMDDKLTEGVKAEQVFTLNTHRSHPSRWWPCWSCAPGGFGSSHRGGLHQQEGSSW